MQVTTIFSKINECVSLVYVNKINKMKSNLMKMSYLLEFSLKLS